MLNHHIHGSPVFWNSPAGPYLYIWGENDQVRAYALAGRTFQTPAAQLGAYRLPSGMPGGILSISADGSAPGSGILWATHPTSGNANKATRPGTLRAYDAGDLSRELWTSRQNPGRDDLGNFAKFNPPMVADGKVYVASFSSDDNDVTDELVVYGLLAPAIVKAPLDVVMDGGERAVLQVVASGAGPLAYQWYLGESGDTSRPIDRATESSYATPSLTRDTDYWVRITNRYGSIDSATVRVLVEPARMSIALPLIRR
jgi:hypothetical protein